jgi:hypothetical protein
MRAMRCSVAGLLLLAVVLCAAGGRAQTAPVGRSPASPAGLGALHIHVRGAAELHAVATADHGELTVHGELIDDAGTPIAGAPIAVQAFSADSPQAALHVGPLRACDDAAGHAVPRGGPDDLVVETDDRGGFCAIGRAPVTPAPTPQALKMTLKLRFRGSKLHDSAELTVPVEAAEAHLLRTILRFEPPPETLDLDRESITVTASVRVDRSETARQGPAGSAQRASLPLVLTDERGAHVADALTGGDGRARFEVKTTALAGPGSGELVVRFAGNAVLGKAEWSQPVVRRAEAHLALAHPVERADAEEGVPIDVEITAAHGPVSGGVVEVRRVAPSSGPISTGEPRPPGGDSVGAGTVDEQGHARIFATFAAGGATQVALALRYVPAAPWYRPGPELRIDVKLAGPGIGRQILLAALVIAAAAWVVGGWRRSPRPPVALGIEGSRAPPSGRPGVHVLASPPDLVGWRGTVTDAHDGSPVAGARLAVVAPSFEGDGVVARAVADDHGSFTLEVAYRTDARLVVDSVDHSTHEQALPPPSVLGVALITRRRAILERLVRWARQKGAPFDGSPEPTPGHVRRVASRASAQEVEAWAGRVEQAAYGPGSVDADLEREVRSAEPRALR